MEILVAEHPARIPARLVLCRAPRGHVQKLIYS